METVPNIYRLRDALAHRLSDAAFSELNKGVGSAVSVSVTGCIDAPDSIPTGCMTGFSGRDGWRYVTMGTIERGISLDEHEARQAIAERLITEILAEEEAKKRPACSPGEAA